jgi:hypothetical protein
MLLGGEKKPRFQRSSYLLLNELSRTVCWCVCWRDVYPGYSKTKSIHKVRVDANSIADVNSFFFPRFRLRYNHMVVKHESTDFFPSSSHAMYNWILGGTLSGCINWIGIKTTIGERNETKPNRGIRKKKKINKTILGWIQQVHSISPNTGSADWTTKELGWVWRVE